MMGLLERARTELGRGITSRAVKMGKYIQNLVVIIERDYVLLVLMGIERFAGQTSGKIVSFNQQRMLVRMIL
jgi:hypothetical protein